MPWVTPSSVAAMGEFSQHWRNVSWDVRVPLAAMDEVSRMIVRVQQREPWDFLGWNAKLLELDLKFVAIDAYEAHLGQCLLHHRGGESSGYTITWFTIGNDEPEDERLVAGFCRTALLV